MISKDYYLILGVSRSESPSGIRARYRDLVRTLHPDVAGARSFECFPEIAEAYNSPNGTSAGIGFAVPDRRGETARSAADRTAPPGRPVVPRIGIVALPESMAFFLSDLIVAVHGKQVQVPGRYDTRLRAGGSGSDRRADRRAPRGEAHDQRYRS
jgi:hypothetical protein